MPEADLFLHDRTMGGSTSIAGIYGVVQGATTAARHENTYPHQSQAGYAPGTRSGTAKNTGALDESGKTCYEEVTRGWCLVTGLQC
jgi:hypothetical protein